VCNAHVENQGAVAVRHRRNESILFTFGARALSSHNGASTNHDDRGIFFGKNGFRLAGATFAATYHSAFTENTGRRFERSSVLGNGNNPLTINGFLHWCLTGSTRMVGRFPVFHSEALFATAFPSSLGVSFPPLWWPSTEHIDFRPTSV
jgi:hypothetical protein